MPKVSVIIPTYNCAQFLPEAIESVLAQTFQDFEIIIVDDGSTDRTAELLEGYVRKYPDKIKYIFQENKGLAVARNTGIKNAAGEYIALLDADDLWTPDRLAETVAALDQNPEVGLVHANISWMSEDGSRKVPAERDQRFLSGRLFGNIFLRTAHVSIPTVLVRRTCFDKAGLFDENLARLGCEDREMWLRIAQNDRFLYVDRVLGHYRCRQGSMSKDQTKMLQARYYVVDKFTRGRPALFLLRCQALARIHKDLGDEFLSGRKFAEARGEYLKAFVLWPFNIWTFLNLGKSVFHIQGKKIGF